MSPFRLAAIHLSDSPESKTTHVKHNCARPHNIVKIQLIKAYFINETGINTRQSSYVYKS